MSQVPGHDEPTEAAPPSEAEGRLALRDHLLEKAGQARRRHGPRIGPDEIRRILDDREVVRYPTGLRFDAEPLRPGEFALAVALGTHPRAGFCVYVHPRFEHRPEAWAALIAYHIPPINYGDIVTPEDCEHFGAFLLGLEVEEYYARLCGYCDEIWGPPDRADA